MDKSSPVYENFTKKMDAMKGGPKISKSTMKIGGGIGLEKRVGNNEKKITLLKNIFKAQKQEIGEKITPKVSNLELSLNETTNILKLVTEKLSIDMSQRLADQKALFDAQRKQNLDDKRENEENKLEERVKSQKIGTKISKQVLKPFGNIFDKLLNLAGILGTGLLTNNFLKSLEDKDFVGKLQNIFNWTKENWKALAIGAGILGSILLGGAILGVIGSIGTVFAVLTSPVVLTILGIIGLAALKNTLDKKVEKDMRKYYDPKNDADNTRKFLGNEIPGAPVNAQPGDFFTAGNGITYEKLPFNNSLGGWKKVSKGKNEEEFKRFIDMNEKGINTRNDGTFIPKDLSNEYLQNRLNRTTGASFLPFVGKGINLRELVKEKGVGTIFEELPDIDLRSDKRNQIGEVSENPATGIPDISSVNMSNLYMEQVPDLFGFSDIIYS